MKKLLFYLAAVLAVSCAKDPPVSPQQEPVVIELQTRSGLIEAAVYDATLDVWMAPNPAPQPFSSGTPTHYQLKIYPKTEAEQWEVETMEDVRVQYIPFGYLQLTEDERVKVASTEVHSDIIEVSPYTITYTDYESTDGGPTGPVTFQLPILYATWPMDKALPEGMEYVVEGEIAQAEPVATRMTRAASDYPYIQLMAYDNVLQRNVPLAYMDVRYNVTGSPYVLYYTTTDANGRFQLSLYSTTKPASISLDLHLSYSNTEDHWMITTDTSSASIFAAVSTYLSPTVMQGGTQTIVVPEGTRNANTIFRAATYFYRTQTDFPRYTMSRSLKIEASESYAGSKTGYFTGYTTNNPHILVYRSGTAFGTTLHELGHFTHYRGYEAGFLATAKRLLSESFASYLGWYLGEKYYKSFGWTPSYSGHNVTGNSNQKWNKDRHVPATPLSSDPGWYSPLFIDITDYYNQQQDYSTYLWDEFNGIQPYTIWYSIITQCSDWASCRPLIKRQLTSTQRYSEAAIEAYLANYDHWHSNYDN